MSAPPCLTCRLRLAVCRGCCARCYSRHQTAARGGASTWAALEQAGLTTPAQPRGNGWRHWHLHTGDGIA